MYATWRPPSAWSESIIALVQTAAAPASRLAWGELENRSEALHGELSKHSEPWVVRLISGGRYRKVVLWR